MYSGAIYRVSVLWALVAIAAPSLWAQPLHLPYRHFSVHDGLPQQQITSLFQDSRGYVWVGTKFGISKYNGLNFVNYSVAEGLPGDHVEIIAEDLEKNIWVKTPTGAGYYDGVSWKRVTSKILDKLVISDSLILCYEYKTNTLWRLKKDTVFVFSNLDNPNQLKQSKNTVFASFMYKVLPNLVDIFLSIDKEGNVISLDTVDKKTKYFIAERNNSRYYHFRYRNSSKGWVPIYRVGQKQPIDSIWLDVVENTNPHGMFYARDGSLYYDWLNDILHRETGKIKARGLSLPIEMVSCMLEDSEGSIWVGSEQGLFQYFPKGFQSISSIDVPMPWGIFEDKKSLYWICSYGYGLKQFDGKQIKKVDLPNSVFGNDGSKGFFYFGNSEDHMGSLYFSHQSGLMKYDGKRWQNLLKKELSTANEPWKTAVILNHFDPEQKKILAATYGRVLVYDPGKDLLSTIPLPGISNFVEGLAHDSKGNWWFSSGDGGIARYHIASEKVNYYHEGKDGVPLSGALCVEPDPGSGLWFGGREGLFYFNEETGVFRKVASSSVHGKVFSLIVVDSLLMIGNVSGLYVLNLNAFHRNSIDKVKAYNLFNGFSGIGPKQNSAMLDSKGNYWIVCSNQIAFIHKSIISLLDSPTKVRICQVNEKRVPFSGSGTIHLAVGENEVTVRFESIGFQRPLRTQYSWRVSGFRDEWSMWTKDEIAFLSRMPSGNYTFEVRSRHPGIDDATAYITDRYNFTVSLPFYKEPGFYKFSFFGFGIAVTIGGMLLWYIRKAKKEAQVAKKMAEERERLIKYYQVQTLQAQLNPHFIFNLLETIQQYVEQQKRPEAVEQIQRLAKLLRRFLDSSINSDLESIGEGSKEISLNTEIELLRYYVELEQIQKPGLFEFTIDVSEKLQPSNIFVTPMIIQPFVENAIKRGLIPKIESPRNLWIRFMPNKDGIRCIIEDNGIGMEASRQLQAKSNRKYKPRGVSLVRERAELLQELGVLIEIEMKDRPAGGTLIIIDFANTTG